MLVCTKAPHRGLFMRSHVCKRKRACHTPLHLVVWRGPLGEAAGVQESAPDAIAKVPRSVRSLRARGEVWVRKEFDNRASLGAEHHKSNWARFIHLGDGHGMHGVFGQLLPIMCCGLGVVRRAEHIGVAARREAHGPLHTAPGSRGRSRSWSSRSDRRR